MRYCLPVAIVLAASAPAEALPPPPPNPVEQAHIDAFFDALPRQLPMTDFTAFEKLVSPDVMVSRDGKIVHRNRASWFAELARNPFAGWQSPKAPVAAGIGRDDFYRSADGTVVVRELTTGMAPEGEHIEYHAGYVTRIVSYVLRDGILVKVDYGLGLDSMRPPAAYRQR